MAGTSADEPGGPVSRPRDDELNTLIKLLTIVGLALGVGQLVAPHFRAVTAGIIAVVTTALLVVAGIGAIRLRRRWHDRMSLTLGMLVLCGVGVALLGTAAGLTVTHLLAVTVASLSGHP